MLLGSGQLVEDDKDVVEAMRLDEQDVMMGDIIDSIVEDGNVSDKRERGR